jgi:hypothetical protein
MTAPIAILSLSSLALFSLADLRYRVVPGVTLFFMAAVLLAAPKDPLRVALVVVAVGWGIRRGWPHLLVLPALFHPSTWVVLLTGAGVRKGMVGGADLLALGGLVCLFGWPVAVMVLVGVELWRRWWKWRRPGSVPALPGMFLGLIAYLLLTIIWA